MDQFRTYPILQNRFHQFVGIHRDGIEHLCALFFGLFAERSGNVFDTPDFPIRAIEVVRLHCDEIDYTFVVAFETDRNLHHDSVVLQFFAQLGHDTKRVCSGPVRLVDEGEPRDIVAAHLAIDGHGLGLHPGHRTQNENRAIENAQRAFDFDREVHMARSVDNVDKVFIPFAVSRRGLDRNTPLPLQFHRIHLRADAVLSLDVVDDPDPLRVKKNSLRQCRLSGINVRADSDVSYPSQIADQCHPS